MIGLLQFGPDLVLEMFGFDFGFKSFSREPAHFFNFFIGELSSNFDHRAGRDFAHPQHRGRRPLKIESNYRLQSGLIILKARPYTNYLIIYIFGIQVWPLLL